MDKNWKISRLKDRGAGALVRLILLVACQNLGLCWCLNEEGESFELGAVVLLPDSLFLGVIFS